MGTTVGDSAPARIGRARRIGRQVSVMVAALAVAAVVLGIVVAPKLLRPDPPASRHPASSSAAGGATSGHHRSGDVVDLDLRPAKSRKAVESCLTPRFATKRGQVKVLYGRWQRLEGRVVPTLILRNRRGQIRLCDAFGPDNPSRLPLRHATAHRPVKFLSGGRKDWSCKGKRLHRFTMTEWLTVDRSVHTVMLRFKVGGTPGPWFVTHPRKGYAHVQAWVTRAGDQQVVVQQRVLGKHGHLVAQRALPRRMKVPGCSGGSVQIL